MRYKWNIKNETLKLDQKIKEVRVNEYKWWRWSYRNER